MGWLQKFKNWLVPAPVIKFSGSVYSENIEVKKNKKGAESVVVAKYNDKVVFKGTEPEYEAWKKRPENHVMATKLESMESWWK